MLDDVRPYILPFELCPFFNESLLTKKILLQWLKKIYQNLNKKKSWPKERLKIYKNDLNRKIYKDMRKRILKDSGWKNYIYIYIIC